jgi:hypothetical protein
MRKWLTGVFAVGLVLAAMAIPPLTWAERGAEPAEAQNTIEGTVSGVDWSQGRISIGGVAGFLGTEIYADANTKVVGPQEQKMGFQSIAKGDVIKARYRKVGDKNVADRITVLFKPGQGVSGQAPSGQGAAQEPSNP